MQIVKPTYKYLLVVSLVSIASKSYTQQPTPAYPISVNLNYVRTWNAIKPDSNKNNFTISNGLQTAVITTNYVDGLGRSVQNVTKQGSYPTGGSSVDLVVPTLYDEFGRESIKYLPFAANTAAGNTSVNDGAFKLNPFHQDSAFSTAQYSGETWFYGQDKYEPSPLNRIAEAFAPGNSWVGTVAQSSEDNRHSVKSKYWVNRAADSVRLWTVSDNTGSFGSYTTGREYPVGSLFKNVTIDEQGKQIIEFKDKEEKIILKKVQLTASADTGAGKGYYGWLCTYYLYDCMNRLRAVIQPAGVETLRTSSWNLTTALLNEQFFRYEYDHRGRMVKKKVPGAGEEWMVYDARDRLVLTQDSMLRSIGYWKYKLYDKLNRVIETGSWNNSNDLNYHSVRADTSIVYPAGGSGYTTFTVNQYDTYAGIPGFSDGTRITTYDEYLLTPSNSWPYPQAATQSTQVRGLLTSTSARNGETTVNIYDEKGRIIQTQTANIVWGIDVTSIQYAWNGSPLIKILRHERNDGYNPETTTIVTKMTYDDLFRLTKIEKKVGSNFVNDDVMTPYHVISEQTYNAVGQLSSKKLGRKKDSEGEYTSDPLETLSYEYNIRGWLLGVNRPYLNEGLSVDNKFGYELAYDKRTSVIDNYVSNTYNTSQYDGNITGVMWRSVGDGERRKYDFDYDANDRLLKADFTQHNGTWNVANGIDFSMKVGDGIHPDSAYDVNGNILSLSQKGVQLTSSSTIDDLRYTYEPNSNKLLEVNDAANDTLSQLGDFKDVNEDDEANDYTYDGNGNLIQDKNKNISQILYDKFFNLPMQIMIGQSNDSGVSYAYDGSGKKYEKIVYDIPGWLDTHTKYAGEFTYSGSSYYPTYHTLQYFNHEEGRVRFIPATADVPAQFAFDYFIPDHLGSIRMVLTEEQRTDSYIPASLETDNLETENFFYGALDSNRVNKDTVSGYPNDEYTDPNDFIQKLDGNNYTIGANKTLKVMSGDQVNIRVNSWYKRIGGYSGLPSNPLLPLIAAMTDGIGTISQAHTLIADELQGQTVNPLDNVISSFLDTEDDFDTSKPRAFINWVLFDEQFKFVSSGSGFEQVGTNEEFKTHTIEDIPVTKNGYLYVYVSNQSSNVNVYFDNLQVTHVRGPLLGETHYYPFGLTMHGISSKALAFGDPENKNNKFQNQELNDDFGINYYEFKYRNHDPQIGRFIQIDPLSSEYVHNSTYAFSENKVTNHVELEGLEATPAGYLQRGFEQIGIGAASAWDRFTSFFTQHKSEQPVSKSSYTGATVVATTKTTTEFGTNLLGWVLNGKKPDATVSNGPSLFKAETTVTFALELKQEVKTNDATISTKTALDGSSIEVKVEKGAVIEGVPVKFSLSNSQNFQTGENKTSAQAGVGAGGTSAFGLVEIIKQNQKTTNVNVSVGIQSQTGASTNTFSIGKSF